MDPYQPIIELYYDSANQTALLRFNQSQIFITNVYEYLRYNWLIQTTAV